MDVTTLHAYTSKIQTDYLQAIPSWVAGHTCNICERVVGKKYSIEYEVLGRVCDRCMIELNSYMRRRAIMKHASICVRRLELIADVRGIITNYVSLLLKFTV